MNCQLFSFLLCLVIKSFLLTSSLCVRICPEVTSASVSQDSWVVTVSFRGTVAPAVPVETEADATPCWTASSASVPQVSPGAPVRWGQDLGDLEILWRCCSRSFTSLFLSRSWRSRLIPAAPTPVGTRPSAMAWWEIFTAAALRTTRAKPAQNWKITARPTSVKVT